MKVEGNSKTEVKKKVYIKLQKEHIRSA